MVFIQICVTFKFMELFLKGVGPLGWFQNFAVYLEKGSDHMMCDLNIWSHLRVSFPVVLDLLDLVESSVWHLLSLVFLLYNACVTSPNPPPPPPPPAAKKICTYTPHMYTLPSFFLQSNFKPGTVFPTVKSRIIQMLN